MSFYLFTLHSEWSTGQFFKATFNEKNREDQFKAHLRDLTDWNIGNPVIIGEIHNKIFKCALYMITYASVSSVLTCHSSHSAGTLSLEATSCDSNNAKLCAQQELQGRMGDTNSEEGEHREEDGDGSD